MIRALDLFCGAGGSSWGARQAGVSIVAGIDAWPLATRTFKANFPEAEAINITLNRRSGPEVLGKPGRIDLLLASPECTNHTCALGSRERDEKSRETAFYVLRFADKLKPRWIVIENVIHMKAWAGYRRLLDHLSSDYRIRTQVLDASDFGVPQSRKRLFILCDREREPAEILPVRSSTSLSARSVLDWNGTWPMRPLYREERAKPTIRRAERAMNALGRRMPFLLVYYGTDKAGGWQDLGRPLRTLTTLDRFALVRWKNGTPMMRMLQVPEIQRAMGFDDRFSLDYGTRRERIKLLGNAVCPPVMRQIVNVLLNKS